MRCRRNEVSLCCIDERIPFDKPRSERRKRGEENNIFRGAFIFCMHSKRHRNVVQYPQFHLVNRSLVFNSSVSLGTLDRCSPHSQVWGRNPSTKTMPVNESCTSKEGRLALTLQSQRKRNCVPLSSVLAFTLLAHGGSVFAPRVFFFVEPLGTRVLVGTSSRQSSHPSRSLRSRKQAQLQRTSPIR